MAQSSAAGRGGRVIGDYAVGRQIGSGSFSVVAIKEIAMARLNKKLQESLMSEIIILRKINHPNIIRFIDMIEIYGASWFVILFILLIVKGLGVGRQRFSTNFQLLFRIIKGFVFLTFLGILITFIALRLLTPKDIFLCMLAFMPTGWGMLLGFDMFRVC